MGKVYPADLQDAIAQWNVPVRRLPDGQVEGAGNPWTKPQPAPVDIKCVSCGAHYRFAGPISNIDVPKLRCTSCNSRKLKVNSCRVRGKGGRLRWPWNQQQPFEPITDERLPSRMTKAHQRAEQRRMKLVGHRKPFRQGVGCYPVLDYTSPLAARERETDAYRCRVEARCAKAGRAEAMRAQRWRKELSRKARAFIGECQPTLLNKKARAFLQRKARTETTAPSVELAGAVMKQMHLGEYQVRMQGYGRKSEALPEGKVRQISRSVAMGTDNRKAHRAAWNVETSRHPTP
jgi:hypothetical protein